MSHEKIVISSAGLDTTADNYDEFDIEINPEDLGDKLVQTNILKGTISEYQLHPPGFLLLKSHKKNDRSGGASYRVSLAYLDPEPVHNRVVIWKWLYFALFIAVLAGLSFYLAQTQATDTIYFLVAGSIASTTSVIFLLIFVYLIRDEYIFRSRYGNARIFKIENRKPDKETFDHFFSNLNHFIHKAQHHISVSDRLVSELKMCRYLRDKNILNEETYTRARTAIFKHEQYKT
jgi:hypothetical protein